jgi:two-component system OmpR family sensor kinase
LSLRTRLTAALLVVAAVGMVVVGAVIYAEQRSFLLDRADDDARAAIPPLTVQLGGNPGPGAPGGPPPGGNGPAPRGNLGRAPGFGTGGPPPDRDRDGRGRGGPRERLPAGTYGQRRSAGGKVLASISITFGGTARAAPRLPKKITPGRTFTVSSRDGSFDYRVTSRVMGDGTVTIAAVPLEDVDETLDRLLLVEALVIGGSLLLIALVTLAAVRLGLRPLDRFGRTADAIAGGELSHRVSPADDRTEVGRLGISLNQMLDRLQEAFTEREASEARLRQFIADASHELRTPLTSIRGYSELFRLGADADPAETAKALRRIEDEAARMGVLVEDLLALARLEEPEARLHEPVVVAKVAADAVEDARAIAPDRAIEFVSDESACVEGDPLQLHQVVANLLRNAIAHTPAGTPIEVSVRRRGAKVLLTVRDHGPGLPDVDPETLFERFWRAEAGRVRGKAGAGLGLAIVAGIVHVHGGEVRAEDALGGGASFVVELPALPAVAAPPTPPAATS